MSERFILLQSNPLSEISNVTLLFYSSEESSQMLKLVNSKYQVLSQETIYSFYNSHPPIVSIMIHPTSDYKEYTITFETIIPWFISKYGKILTILLPESDNFQSISTGLFAVLNRYIQEDVVFKVYTEQDYSSILKLKIDSSQFMVNQNQFRERYLKNFFICSQCGKFPYIPRIKQCCKKLICIRCAERDVINCTSCNSPFIAQKTGNEFEELCRNAPYLCKCGKEFPFKNIDLHITSCVKAEVECRVCKEMTKMTNFGAHFRINHVDLITKMLEYKK
jgi:hypothetical protein